MTNEEFAALPHEAQQTIRAGLAMQAILADADAARVVLPQIERVTKKQNPAYVTIEEQAAPIVERVIKQVDEKLSARDKKAEEDAAVTRLNAQIQSAKDKDGFTDEGIQKVLKMMQEKGIGDFDSALKVYRYDNPPAQTLQPTSSSRSNWNAFHEMQAGDNKPFFFPENSPSITENPQGWEKDTALKYLNGETGLPNS